MMIPMTLIAQVVKNDASTEKNVSKGYRSVLRKNVTAPANQQVRKLSTSIKDMLRAPKFTPSADAITWDFESEDVFNEWTIVDKDNDGFKWEYHNNEGLESGIMEAHGGYGLVVSASYDNDSHQILTPDNWIISPEVTLGGALSLWACGQDASYAAEVFGIFVCVGNSTNPDDFVQVGADKTTTSEWASYEYDLSSYAGQTGRFAIRHYNVSDQFILKVDDVCLDVNAVLLPDPTAPTNITADPAATTADVAWDGAEGDTWNLRYKVYVPNEKQSFLWDLTVANYSSQVDGWSIYDADGDGNNWGLSYGGYDPNGSLSDNDNIRFVSESYNSDGALSPDNWLLTPDLKLGGTFKFWAMNDNFPDILGVYVVTDEGQFKLGEDITAPTTWTEYTFDTSEFEGQEGSLAFRHYNSTDQWRIYVDYISYEKPGDEPAEWIEVNGLTDPNYTIEGLEPGTEYIVEVQAYNEQGETEWSEATHFTTLDNVVLDEASTSNSDIIAANNGVTCGVTLTRSIVPGTYNTLCLPFDVDNDLLKATFGDDVELARLNATHMQDGTLYFDFTTADAITAGNPYLIYVSAAVPNPITFNKVMVKEDLETISTSLADFIPVFDVTTLDNGNEDVLFLGANNTLYYPNASSGDLKGFRAFFEVTGEAQGAKTMVVLDNSLTGIKTVLNENLQNENVYDLQGRMVNNPEKGVYIVNGKKVIIK